MTKQKTVPELKAELAANERQLTQLRHKQQQLENRAAYYEKGDRRKRAHHLITRGAAMTAPASKPCLRRSKRDGWQSVSPKTYPDWDEILH